MPITGATLASLNDALAGDLETLQLPDHHLWKYVKPVGLRVDLGKWLAVYPFQITPELAVTGNTYDDQVGFRVDWHVPTPTVADSNTGAQAIAKEQLDVADRILAKLRSYALAIPNLGTLQSQATVVHVEMGITNDMTWRLRAEINCEVWW